jgi:hypothetical protein
MTTICSNNNNITDLVKSIEPLYVIRCNNNTNNSNINIQYMYGISILYNNTKQFNLILFGNSIGEISLINLNNRRILHCVKSESNSPIVSIDSNKPSGLINITSNNNNNNTIGESLRIYVLNKLGHLCVYVLDLFITIRSVNYVNLQTQLKDCTFLYNTNSFGFFPAKTLFLNKDNDDKNDYVLLPNCDSNSIEIYSTATNSIVAKYNNKSSNNKSHGMIMCCSMCNNILLLGYEDGVVEWICIEMISGSQLELKLLASETLHQTSVLSIAIINVSSDNYLIFTTSTESLISISNIDNNAANNGNYKINLLNRVSLPHAGISSIIVFNLEDNSFNIATGGWDHRIRIFNCKFNFKEENHYPLISINPVSLGKYHSSTINSLICFPNDSSILLCSSGSNELQHIAIWLIH